VELRFIVTTVDPVETFFQLMTLRSTLESRLLEPPLWPLDGFAGRYFPVVRFQEHPSIPRLKISIYRVIDP
jgi:hypothetical protein